MTSGKKESGLVELARMSAIAPLGLLYAGSGFTALMLSTGIGKAGYDAMSIAGSSVGLAAVAGACGLGIAVARNIKLSDFSEAGPALRGIGQEILEKAKQAGQALGLLKEGQTATSKLIVDGVSPKEPWSKMAIESVALMVSPTAIMANAMALGATVMTLSGDTQMIPLAVGSLATAVAADYLLYKTMNNAYSRGSLEKKELAQAKREKDGLTNSAPSLG